MKRNKKRSITVAMTGFFCQFKRKFFHVRTGNYQSIYGLIKHKIFFMFVVKSEMTHDLKSLPLNMHRTWLTTEKIICHEKYPENCTNYIAKKYL